MPRGAGDDVSHCTGATNATTFIGVIDDVLDSTARRANMVKKTIVKGARHIRPPLVKKGGAAHRRSEKEADDVDEEGSPDTHGSDHSWNAVSHENHHVAASTDAGSKGDSHNSQSSSSSSSLKKKKKHSSSSPRPTPPTHPSIESPQQQQAATLQREQRKERVKQKLEKYKSERLALQSNCTALETQLLQTAEKLREIDSQAAYRIDSLECELQRTREGMENLVHQSTKEVIDQSVCIKTLGKKLIRQAHVIKQQRKAVEEYQIQLEALREEMAMQDERDSSRDEEYNELKEDFERTLQQKVAMQNSLQESVEEMMDLKMERDRAAARIRELELTLQEKEIDLERARKENVQLAERVNGLETEVQDKTDEVEVATSKLKASEQSVEVMKAELERTNAEIEELRGKTDDASGSLHSSRRENSSFKGWRRGSSYPGVEDESTLEEKLQAKELQVQALDRAAKENEETIKTLRSDMVKMSSTFKQEDYLKRKQIAKLKQDNAEYALKLRALERAFKGVHSDNSPLAMLGSRHAKSMHAASSSAVSSPSKEDRANAVKARLGGSSSLAPYEFPSETGSDEGRKGEWPEEC
ncbi:hypothetical protein HJC23_012105 [Cyclotella cryptica]|uniref:Cilia- and flagella-associated protein 157 n=1 Tax=Cyclotella cryptica TaxID=29204 RepID=A0ABD3P5F5_9STRA|eukprot:CCRYP_017435-RA/>CCRYP_017435-RA protein AED:0.00 eAED:0.00 QI:323/-1/1/1/-1/1/1/1820/585